MRGHLRRSRYHWPVIMVNVGLCGPSMKLGEYPLHFGVLEVQQTFYQPPMLATLRRWRTAMPAPFEFTIKAWQLITHSATTSSTYRRLRRPLSASERTQTGGFQDTAIVDEGWATTLACAAELAATAIVFQCPASFRPTDSHVAAMRAFFTRIARPPRVRLMWEPRGPWPGDLVRGLCRELDLVHVVDPFVTAPETSRPAYFRLHGITGTRHVYTDAELGRLLAMVSPTGTTYVMFNNLARVFDAQRFQALLLARSQRHITGQ